MKPGAYIPIGLTLVALVGGAIVGAYREFVTAETHAKDMQTIESELAGVSLNQQSIAARNQIRWLEQELDEIEKQYGTNINAMPADVRKRYKRLVRELEDERAYYQDIREKLKK